MKSDTFPDRSAAVRRSAHVIRAAESLLSLYGTVERRRGVDDEDVEQPVVGFGQGMNKRSATSMPTFATSTVRPARHCSGSSSTEIRKGIALERRPSAPSMTPAPQPTRFLRVRARPSSRRPTAPDITRLTRRSPWPRSTSSRSIVRVRPVEATSSAPTRSSEIPRLRASRSPVPPGRIHSRTPSVRSPTLPGWTTRRWKSAQRSPSRQAIADAVANHPLGQRAPLESRLRRVRFSSRLRDSARRRRCATFLRDRLTMPPTG